MLDVFGDVAWLVARYTAHTWDNLMVVLVVVVFVATVGFGWGLGVTLGRWWGRKLVARQPARRGKRAARP